MTKTWTWSRQGWVCSTPDPTANTVVAESGVPYRAVTLPSTTTAMEESEEEDEGFARLMQVQRDALGLSLDDVSLMTGVSVRTLARAEDDPVYRPQYATRERLSWFYGDAAWLPVGYHVIDLEHDEAERQAAAVEKAASFLARCLRAPYRRRATGATKALTWLIMGGRIGPFLLLSSLLPPRHRPEPQPLDPPLSSEEEREFGFPERRYGEVVQHEGNTVQQFVRVASTYASALVAGRSDAVALLYEASDLLADVTDEDLSYVLGMSRTEIRQELRRHQQHDWTTGRPKVAGEFWQILEVAEVAPEWEAATTQPPVFRPQTDDLPEPTRLDDAVDWVLAHEDAVATLLEVPLAEVEARLLPNLCHTQAEVQASLRAAAKWAATLPGEPASMFAERVQRVCGGGRDGTREVRGLGLDPEVVSAVVDLPSLLHEALEARAREHALWCSVSDWITQPLHGPEPSVQTPAHQLSQALLSLLPEPPIAERVCVPPAEAQVVIATLGPQFLPELLADADRGRRFVLGALRDWLTHHRGVALPLRAVATQRRTALIHGVAAARAGRGEETTAGKMARALLFSLSRPLTTPGLALSTREVQARLRTGLPYFFPIKISAADRYAHAQRLVLLAWQTRHVA